MFMYQPPLSTQICAQIGGMCCNALCSESTCTHPLCSSFLHVGLFREGLQLFYISVFLTLHVHIITVFILQPFFNKYFPALGWLLLYFLLTCSCINRCCQHKFAHKLDDCAAMLSVVNRFVPIHFVAVFFTLVCFWGVCRCLSREIAWRLIHVHSWKEGCSMVTIRAAFYCFSRWPLFRGYKTVGAGFLRPRTNSHTSASSCHQKKWLTMLDVEYWDVKLLQTVLRFYVEFQRIFYEDLGNL